MKKTIALCLFSACFAQAQVSFILSGYTAGATFDYLNNQAVSFRFALGSSFADNSDSYFSATDNNWNEENTTHEQLWSAVSGTNITGAYARPISSFIDPSSALAVHSSGAFGVFQINAGADEVASNIGISVNSGEIRRIQVNLSTGGPSFSYNEVYKNPAQFFANYQGSYAVTGDIYLTAGATTHFIVDTLTIIPEPANMAILTGFFTMMGAIFMRNRRRK